MMVNRVNGSLRDAVIFSITVSYNCLVMASMDDTCSSSFNLSKMSMVSTCEGKEKHDGPKCTMAFACTCAAAVSSTQHALSVVSASTNKSTSGQARFNAACVAKALLSNASGNCKATRRNVAALASNHCCTGA